MGDRDVSGTAKSSLSIMLFLSSCFRTVLRYGRHLHIQSDRRRSWTETEDTMVQERLRKVPVNLIKLDLFVVQRVECKRVLVFLVFLGFFSFTWTETDIWTQSHPFSESHSS